MARDIWLTLLVVATAVACTGCDPHPKQDPATGDIGEAFWGMEGRPPEPEGPRVTRVLVSPDGRLVLYKYWLRTSDETYWGLVDIDGHLLSERLAIRPNCLFVDWSPDSASIAYSTWHDDRSCLIIRDLADGTEDVIVESEVHSPILDVAWCPTGESIAFTRGQRPQRGLWLVDLASRQARLLADVGMTGIRAQQWDAHGDCLCFLQADPGTLHRVAKRTADPDVQRIGELRDLEWFWVLPDGRVLLMTRESHYGGSHTTYCLVRPDEGAVAKAIAPLTGAGSLALSPDGASLIFPRASLLEAGPGARRDLFRLDIDEPSGARRIITGTTGLAGTGAWTKQGKVVFTCGHQSIWVSDADGNDQRELISLATGEPRVP